MYINIHTHHLAHPPGNLIEVYNQYPWNVLDIDTNYSIGIHPIFINQSNIEQDLITIEEHLNQKKCIAIGEIGLDKITTIDFETQISVFKKQLLIAEKNQIPVIIHCVRAYQEILQIRKQMKLTIPFIFHGFNKNQQIAQQIINQNCFLSFGKNLLYNPNLQAIFANLSAEYFFLENDDSQIPIQEIYQKAAEIRNSSIEDIKEKISINFNRVFKIK